MDFYFFTEPSKISLQTSGQAFGVINGDEYKLDNSFQVVPSATPKAFAVTGGLVLVQKIANTNSYTIILKPTLQPDLDFPKIEYIIYKGIKEDSLVSGNLVAAPEKNDLTSAIHESSSLWYQNLGIPIPSTEPNADKSLGLIYNFSDPQNEYYKEDTAFLDEAFYANDEFTLPTVFAGDYIGDFENTSEIGILFIMEKVGYRPVLKTARELNSVLTFTSQAADASHAEKFERNHQKEDVLAFLDSSAFFSSFYESGLKIKDVENITTETGENLYQTVIAKHYNSNKIYFDIRNECEDSFNYYENYSNFIRLSLQEGELLSDVDYYRDFWPILRLDNSEFLIGQGQQNIKISLYKGDNMNPQFFLKKGRLANLDSNNMNFRFLKTEDSIETDLLYNISDTISVPTVSAGDIVSNYIVLKYIRKYTSPNQTYLGLSLKKESYLDNVFPIFDMHLPYLNEGLVDLKVYSNGSYIDKTNINGIDFTANIGIARDSLSRNFIVFPKSYNEEDSNNRGFLPLYSEQSFAVETFVKYINEKINTKKINSKVYETENDNYDYLTFNEIIPEDESGDDANDVASSENIFTEQPDLSPRFDYENTNILSLTSEQFANLSAIKESEFTSPYKVYLGISGTEYYTESRNAFASTYFALRGIKLTEAGELIAHEYVSDIQIFAEDDLYNYDISTENAKISDAFWVNENNQPTTKVPYGNDMIRIRVKTSNSVGKKIFLECKQNKNWAFDEVRLSHEDIVKANDIIISFKCTPSFFGNGEDGDNIKEYYLNIKIGDGDYTEFCNSSTTRLRIHAIRFVPGLCKKKNWLQAFYAQEYWFNHNSNEDMNTVAPLLNLYPLSWAKGFTRALENYNELKNTKWNSSNSITSLKNEINKMIAANLVSVPTAANTTTQFNTFSDQIVDHATTDIPLEKVPLFEKYYYTSINESASWSDDPIDDLLATLGSFMWHAAAKGNLQHVNNSTMKVTITSLRIYIKDNFDFTEGSAAANYLGEWNFKTNDVMITLLRPENYYTLHNEDYHNYRDEHGKGYDHHRYSIPEDIIKNYEFNMPKP